MEFGDVIRHLLQYSDLYALLASLIAAAAAIGYVFIAFKLVQANVQCRVQPNIIADIGVKGKWFYLLVSNTGTGTAKNIVIGIEPPLILEKQQIKLFRVESLTPEQQFCDKYRIAAADEYSALTQEKRVITVSYADQYDNSFTFNRVFDKRLFDNDSAIFADPYQGIEERLERIEKAIIRQEKGR